MSRFDIDLSDVSSVRKVIKKGEYAGIIAGGEVRTGVKDDRSWASFNLTIAIKDPEVSKLLGIDEPKVFFQGFLSFTEEGKFNKDGCPQFGQFIEVTGFTDLNDFTDNTEDCENEFAFMVKVVNNMIDAAKGVRLLAKVTEAKDQDGEPINRVPKIAKEL